MTAEICKIFICLIDITMSYSVSIKSANAKVEEATRALEKATLALEEAKREFEEAQRLDVGLRHQVKISDASCTLWVQILLLMEVLGFNREYPPFLDFCVVVYNNFKNARGESMNRMPRIIQIVDGLISNLMTGNEIIIGVNRSYRDPKWLDKVVTALNALVGGGITSIVRGSGPTKIRRLTAEEVGWTCRRCACDITDHEFGQHDKTYNLEKYSMPQSEITFNCKRDSRQGRIVEQIDPQVQTVPQVLTDREYLEELPYYG